MKYISQQNLLFFLVFVSGIFSSNVAIAAKSTIPFSKQEVQNIQNLFTEKELEGKTYSETLREAKLKLIEQEGVDPKSWCGFVLLGA